MSSSTQTPVQACFIPQFGEETFLATTEAMINFLQFRVVMPFVSMSMPGTKIALLSTHWKRSIRFRCALHSGDLGYSAMRCNTLRLLGLM